MIDKLDHDDDHMALMYDLVDKVNELVEWANEMQGSWDLMSLAMTKVLEDVPSADPKADLLVRLVNETTVVWTKMTVDEKQAAVMLKAKGLVDSALGDFTITNAGRRWLARSGR